MSSIYFSAHSDNEYNNAVFTKLLRGLNRIIFTQFWGIKVVLRYVFQIAFIVPPHSLASSSSCPIFSQCLTHLWSFWWKKGAGTGGSSPNTTVHLLLTHSSARIDWAACCVPNTCFILCILHRIQKRSASFFGGEALEQCWPIELLLWRTHAVSVLFNTQALATRAY